MSKYTSALPLAGLVATVLLAFTPGLRAEPLVDSDILTLIACKPEGQRWLCGAYQNRQLQTFYSDHNITKVEFRGDLSADNAYEELPPSTSRSTASAPSKTVEPGKKMADAAAGGEPRFTLQLLACKSDVCRRRMDDLKRVPGSYVVAIKQEGALWDVLIHGGFATSKAAKRRAGELMLEYQLSEKPWVRSMQSIAARRVVQ